MDQQAIDLAVTEMLNPIGSILDHFNISPAKAAIQKNSILADYFKLLKKIESLLLSQWKIKAEQGTDHLIVWQKNWFLQELRKENNILEKWNNFYADFWKQIETVPCFEKLDNWNSFILRVISEYDFHSDYNKAFSNEQENLILSDTIKLFEEIAKFHPDDLILGFFNIIEIGYSKRPFISLIRDSEIKLAKEPDFLADKLKELYHEILTDNDWSFLNKKLPQFWKNNSGGNFSLFPAFQVGLDSEKHLCLSPIKITKWISFSELVGIEQNRDCLIDNADSFLSGKQAQHVLLWGGRGTGKSSSILALLKEFSRRGLRLIEINQHELGKLPEIYNLLKDRPEKFIIFCDDLSFNESDETFKHLKSIMDGSLVKPSENLLIHATSNRKDLVNRDYIDERRAEKKQVLDELRAIDDRFGIKLYYDAPVFRELDQILFYYADQRNLSYEPDALRIEFRQFCSSNNHDNPSGRTVKQFMQYAFDKNLSEN